MTGTVGTKFGKLPRDARGASLVEYLVIVGLVALAAVVAFKMFGSSVSGTSTAQGKTILCLAGGGAGCDEAAGNNSGPGPIASNGPVCTSGECQNGTSCFVAGTPVATPQGLVPIERIVAGDTVLSADVGSATFSSARVTATYVTHDRPVLDVSLVGQAAPLRVTPGHLFFTLDRGWVASEDLLPGEPLVDTDGAGRLVDRVESVEDRATVYNFEVEGTHTYFVGAERVLVHNPTQSPVDQAVGSTVPVGTFQNGGVTIDVQRTRLSNGQYKLSYTSQNNPAYHGYASYEVVSETTANGRTHTVVEIPTITAQPEGKGLGGLLMNQIAQDGQAWGADQMTTLATAPTAQPFYSKLGFYPDSQILSHLHESAPDVPLDELKTKVPTWNAPTDDVLANSNKYASAWPPPPSSTTFWGKCTSLFQ